MTNEYDLIRRGDARNHLIDRGHLVAAQIIAALPAVVASLPDQRNAQKPCTCHPDDNPPSPCRKKYALTDCRNDERDAQIAALVEALKAYKSRAKRIPFDVAMMADAALAAAKGGDA